MHLFRPFRSAVSVSPRYRSATPLFDVDKGDRPLLAGRYVEAREGGGIIFDLLDGHYVVSGGAAPDTVALIPTAAHSASYVFQQSDGGGGEAFYGMLRISDAPGFLLFSPESVRKQALEAADAHGASIDSAGCVFIRPAALLAALLPLSFHAPADCWNHYVPV
ncbi:MAG: hypothetical protein ABW023_16795 [Sphingomonas sp.]